MTPWQQDAFPRTGQVPVSALPDSGRTGAVAAYHPPSAELLPNALVSAGFFFLCLYVISGQVNDLSIRYLGSKAYLSMIAMVMTPVLGLASGQMLRLLRVPMGKWWVAFFVWGLLCIPTSRWVGGSFSLLVKGYGPKIWIYVFLIAGLTANLGSLRRLVSVQMIGLGLLLFACVQLGDASLGRLMIPESLFYENPNDLALQLLILAMLSVSLLYRSSLGSKILGLALGAVALYFILRTSSRGSFVAIGVCFLGGFLLSNSKGKILVGTIVLATISAFVVPRAQWERLFSIAVFSSSGIEDEATLMSQMERQERLRLSVELALKNPLFGVGPGQFADELEMNMKAEGKHVASIGTHNSYTQVASEMGIPAFLFYTMAVLLSVRTSARIYRWAAAQPGKMKEVEGLAYALFLANLGFAVNSFFHHVALAGYFPILLGMTAALQLNCGFGKQPIMPPRDLVPR